PVRRGGTLMRRISAAVGAVYDRPLFAVGYDECAVIDREYSQTKRRCIISIAVLAALMVGCAARVNKTVTTTGTLAELRNMRPDVQEVKVEQGLEQAMQNYRRFLDETPETAMTPEAMRRLADLQLEKQFGIRTGLARARELAAPQPALALAGAPA